MDSPLNSRPFRSPERRPSHNSLDPLSQRPESNNQHDTSSHSKTSSRQSSRQPSAPPSRSQFSVVVTASPNRASYHTPEVTYDDQEDGNSGKEQPVLSDMSPQVKKKMKVKVANEAERDAAAPKMGRQASSAAKQLINKQYDKKRIFSRQTDEASERPSATGASTPNAPSRLGRPRGWKPGMSYAQMRGNPIPTTKPKAGTVGVVKRRGRPPKPPSPPPLELYRMLKPVFLSFLCEWKGCKADLQNLETLRRHVNAVHLEEQDYEEEGVPKEPWTCLWGKCGMASRAPTFKTHEEMEEHVEQRHMIPFGWHIGDGPKVDPHNFKPKREAGEEDDIPSYLKDKDGNQVTPSIKEQRLEDAAEYKERRKRLWYMMKVADDNLPSEDEEEHPEPDDEQGMVL